MRKNTPIIKLSPGHWIQENWRPRCNHFIRTLWLIDLLLLIPIPILKTPKIKSSPFSLRSARLRSAHPKPFSSKKGRGEREKRRGKIVVCLGLAMDESKKRKLAEAGNGELSPTNSEQHLRLLLDPLRKDQLVDLLAKL